MKSILLDLSQCWSREVGNRTFSRTGNLSCRGFSMSQLQHTCSQELLLISPWYLQNILRIFFVHLSAPLCYSLALHHLTSSSLSAWQHLCFQVCLYLVLLEAAQYFLPIFLKIGLPKKKKKIKKAKDKPVWKAQFVKTTTQRKVFLPGYTGKISVSLLRCVPCL